MLRRGFSGNCARASRVSSGTARLAGARRLYANAGTPPSSGGGGGAAFGVLVGTAVAASAWTGYQYYTDPQFRSQLNDMWASLSSSSPLSASSPSKSGGRHQDATGAVPPATTLPGSRAGHGHDDGTHFHEHEGKEQEQPSVLLLVTDSEAAPENTASTIHLAEEKEEAVPLLVLTPLLADDAAPPLQAALEHQQSTDANAHADAGADDHHRPHADDFLGENAPATSGSSQQQQQEAEEKEGEGHHGNGGGARVPSAIIGGLVTESFAASDALHEALAAQDRQAARAEPQVEHLTVAADAETAAHEQQQQQQQQQSDNGHPSQPEHESSATMTTGVQQQQQQQEAAEAENKVVVVELVEPSASDNVVTRLQELQAIKEIVAIQAESCERQTQAKVERLRRKYEQKMDALRAHLDDLVAERVDVERHKLADEHQTRLDQQLASLHRQFEEERQRLYTEMEDVVAGLNARFVELVREEKQLLHDQLDRAARLHTETQAYLLTLVEDAEYRSRHVGEERAWQQWTDQLGVAVRALESAALGPDGHLLPFQAQLEPIVAHAATRPLYKAVAPHLEALAARGVYSMGRLRERFEQVDKHVRVAAQVPEGGGLVRHAVAPLLAATAGLNPYHKPTPQEVLLDTARRHLQEDDLLGTLEAMEQLAGLARELASDWIEEARKRLVVEQAISIIAADVATLQPPASVE